MLSNSLAGKSIVYLSTVLVLLLLHCVVNATVLLKSSRLSYETALVTTRKPQGLWHSYQRYDYPSELSKLES